LIDGIKILQKTDITYLENEIFKNGIFKFKPMEFYRKIPENDIMYFCHKYAFYVLPTIELIEFLKNRIEGKLTIEIGSGNGLLAKELNIKATDSYMQENKYIQQYYKACGQPTISYGKNVIKVDANEAVKKYKPDITIGCFITHKYRSDMHNTGGSAYGPIEENIIKNSKDEYIFIGSKRTHKDKHILKFKHETIELNGLVSRNGFTDNVIWIFKRGEIFD